jgi:aminoglycoside phosphotransferase (APT) family kinase protein
MSSVPPDERAIGAFAARILSPSVPPIVERVAEGVSTYVYRLRQGQAVWYLRVLPEEHASFAPEVFAHQRLRERGVAVPEVLYFEHCNETLERSVMLTTEIKGTSLAHCPNAQAQRRILHAAGRDLANINSLPVQGFGWVQRDKSTITRLQAEHPSSSAFLCEYLERDLAMLSNAQALKRETLTAIKRVLRDHAAWLDSDYSWLAHGDFDVTHIYQDAGRYTGIIDFGEIRGADVFYDLGHFSMHDGETLPALLLPWLLEGYQEITPLPDGYTQRIAFASLLIGIRTLARTGQKRPQSLLTHHALHAIPRAVQRLRA